MDGGQEGCVGFGTGAGRVEQTQKDPAAAALDRLWTFATNCRPPKFAETSNGHLPIDLGTIAAATGPGVSSVIRVKICDLVVINGIRTGMFGCSKSALSAVLNRKMRKDLYPHSVLDRRHSRSDQSRRCLIVETCAETTITKLGHQREAGHG